MKLSILITHFNRPDALENCIKNIYAQNLNISYEIVVSDDNSSQENLKRIKNIDTIKLIQSNVNYGLGANINKGIKACKGDFILYCQEDFFINSNFKKNIDEILNLLANNELQMVRLTANYKFPFTYEISNNIDLIPKFSIKNFLYNAFQYSDNPFIVKNGFHDIYGYYLENINGAYCETEYAIRIMKSKVTIGILKEYAASESRLYNSVLNPHTNNEIKKKFLNKKIHSVVRALRLHLEYLLYSSKARNLVTYKGQKHNNKYS